MDAMKLGKVVLAGHSIAGDEITWLGGHHPERFAALIYLDAAYDRSGDPADADFLRLRELARLLPPEPPIPPEALQDYDAMSRFLEQRGHARYPEGELIALLRVNHPFLAGTPSIDARTQQAMLAGIQAPNYSAMKVPALAIYAIADPDAAPPPWYDAHDTQLRAILAERARITDALKRENIERFRQGVMNGRVLELQKATHNLIHSNASKVLAAIEDFVDEVN
jgi:pimeloyl-ACP methyl ester carboxylesterase